MHGLRVRSAALVFALLGGALSLLFVAGAGAQQSPPCRELVECQIRVLDLREAREFAEAQLAQVKAAYSHASNELDRQRAEVKRLTDTYEPKAKGAAPAEPKATP